MIHSNNTKSAASRRLPRPAQMLLGILTLSACLAPHRPPRKRTIQRTIPQHQKTQLQPNRK